MKRVALGGYVLFGCALGCSGPTADIEPGPQPAAPLSAVALAASSPRAEGAAPEVEFPLRAWMLANLPDAMRGQDFAALARALDEIAQFAPRELPQWTDIALAGARAAERQDIEQVGASCAGCHDKYRPIYRVRMRVRPLVRAVRGTSL